jgi:hypothetical protein
MEADIQAEFVEDLRSFADFIERKGANLPLDRYDCDITVRGFLYDDTNYDYETGETTVTVSAKDKMKQAIKALGKARKEWSMHYLDVQREFGLITLEFSVGREEVCKKVVTGTEEVPEQVIKAYTKETYEWVCDDPALLAD